MVLDSKIYLADAPKPCDNNGNSASAIRSLSQARAVWKNWSILSRPARALHKTGTNPARFRLKNRKRYGKTFKGSKRVVTTLSSELPIALSMPMVIPSAQLGSSPFQSGSAYSSSCGSDYLLGGTAVNFFLSPYIRDRASANHGDCGSENDQERGGDGDINSIGSCSISANDNGPRVPGGNVTGVGRSGSTRPGGATDTTPVERRMDGYPPRSIEEAGPFSESFVGRRKGCGERKEPL